MPSESLLHHKVAFRPSRNIQYGAFPPQRQWYKSVWVVWNLLTLQIFQWFEWKESLVSVTSWTNVLSCLKSVSLLAVWAENQLMLENIRMWDSDTKLIMYTTEMEQIIQRWSLLSGTSAYHFPSVNNLLLETPALAGELEAEMLVLPLPDGLILCQVLPASCHFFLFLLILSFASKGSLRFFLFPKSFPFV